MAQVTIYGKPLTMAEVEAVKRLVMQASCHDGEILVVDAVDSAAPAAIDSAVIVLGTPAACGAQDLEPNLMRAHRSAQRVIWLWPENVGSTELPPAAAKYSYSYVPWDAKKLAAVLADDDYACFETATGETVPKVQTERNLCVDCVFQRS